MLQYKNTLLNSKVPFGKKKSMKAPSRSGPSSESPRLPAGPWSGPAGLASWGKGSVVLSPGSLTVGSVICVCGGGAGGRRKQKGTPSSSSGEDSMHSSFFTLPLSHDSHSEPSTPPAPVPPSSSSAAAPGHGGF
uniref:Uncharacterized protein n=1 Tax=Pipistrellus kuhlii TaxID=59472 RepID=A0A7J7YN17_PIPKU|nr:hypothetical protein mPipKuh1_010056 [Pipistrellus kuhlii]